MTLKQWTGLAGSFDDPSRWSPVGVPTSGDQVVIPRSGPVTVQGVLPTPLTITVLTRLFDGRGGSMVLQDATVSPGTIIDVITEADTYDFSLPSALSFSGAVLNQGVIDYVGYTETVALPAGTTLTNTGTINIVGASTQFTATPGGSPIVNDGLIRITNYAVASLGPFTQKAIIGPSLTGSGTTDVSLDANLELGGAIGPGQTLAFVGGSNADATVQIDSATLFAGTITGFVTGDTLILPNFGNATATYQSTGPSSGTLQLTPAGSPAPTASLNVQGLYTLSTFQLTTSGSSLTLTTAVTDPASGATTPPTTSGLFRFFNQTDGTHFYTASIAERDSLLTSNQDLVEEPNGFGTVTTATSATSPVYRFFDQVHGTHFYTASASERDQVEATRPDLTYEPTSSFQEYTAQNASDTPVYRLFSTTDGTHFYTAYAAELSALTTPGTPTYRPDLIPEGISFYAPSGTFT